MGVVVTTFVVGGNIEKLLCEPLANRQIFKVLAQNSNDDTVKLSLTVK